MAKLLKIVWRTISRIVGITLEWVMLIVILFAFLIRTSSFQTYLGDVVTSYLSSELDTELRIGKIEIVFLDKLLLKDVYVQDLKKDTLASVGTIEVNLDKLDLTNNNVIISSVLIDQGRIGINRDKKTGDYNYQFIADYFSSDKPKNSSSKPMSVLVKEINLDNIDLSYEDFRKEHMPYGLDYDYLHFRNVNLTINQFVSDDGMIGFNIDKFTAVEQSGLNLQMLRLKAVIDPKKGILLSKIRIETPTTAIYASHFNLRAKSFEDFNTFNSKVVFDASIDSSRVDLKDVSYFVPALEGMDQMVALSAALSKPLEKLTISDLDLRFGTRSVVRGDFVLPDFSLNDEAKLNEDLEYCFVDLDDVKNLHLPKSAGMKSIELQPMIDQLAFVELREVKVNGQMKQFVMSSEKIGTSLGNIKLNNGIQFTSLNEGGYAFTRTTNSNFDVYVDSFQLGNFIDQEMFGSVTGSAFLTGVVGQKDGIRLTELSGDFQKFGFNNYNYSNIKVYDGSFIDNVFQSKIDIDDPHLAMKFDGLVDVSKKQRFDFNLEVAKADLGALHFDSDPNASLVAGMNINLTGTNIDNYAGTISLEKLVFKENGKTIESPQMDITLLRGASEDHFLLKSDVAEIDMFGKISSGNIAAALNNSFAELVPTIISPMKMSKKPNRKEFFHGTITLKNTEQIFALYYPELHISPGTKIDLSYDSQTNVQTMNIQSDEVALIPVTSDTSKVQKQYLSNLVVDEKLTDGQMNMTIKTDRASYNDSLYVDSFNVVVDGTRGDFDTKIVWNQGEADPASFEVETQLLANNEIAGKVKPSYFSVKGEQWDIKQESKFDINIANRKIVVDKLMLERENQSIRLDGTLSDDPNDVVNLDLTKVHIEEFSKIFAPGTDIVGRLDGHASLSTPFTMPQARGNISLTQFYMNKTEIGDVIMDEVTWNPVKESMILSGKLAYLNNDESIKITGVIYPFREKENYRVGIKFKNTDLKFTNAFIDPSVVSGIKGALNGTLNITGLLEAPEISGQLDLNGAGAKIGILGTTYTMSGKINFDGKNDFISASLPVTDSDGNIAIADLQISHQAFKNFDVNLDFWFDEETVYGIYRKPYTGKFMVLNTVQKEGDIYYGKAYASGYANLAIHETLTEIEVHAKTEKGTEVNLPLYGISDVSEYDFIEFEGAEDKSKEVEDSGLEIALSLEVTNEAQVKLIFNEKTGDAITAYGNANPLTIKISRYGNTSMVGTYVFAKSPEGKRGGYDFNLPPIKERFDIEEGGSVKWSGTPYDSELNVTALKTVVADMNTLADDGSTNGAARKRKVECVMKVGGMLSKPSFDVGLKLLDGNQNDIALLNRATTTVDDTQRQWFKLLATHSFAPLNGGGGGGGATSAGMDLAGQYLDQILKGLGGQDIGFQSSGGNSMLTFQKNLGKNVIVRGSGGVAVENGTGQTGNTSSLMGDMSIDVLLNDDGTFKMTIFNEPNSNNALASKENGDYTQGIGLNYSEQFNQTKDSRLLNTIKDPLNRKGLRKKRNKNKVPASGVVPIVVSPKPPEDEKKPDPKPDPNAPANGSPDPTPH